MKYTKHGGLNKGNNYSLAVAGFHVKRGAGRLGGTLSGMSFISIPMEGVKEGAGTDSGSCWEAPESERMVGSVACCFGE